TPSLFDRQAGARRPAASYALSFAALAAAVLLRSLLDPWMGDALPLVTLFGAVAMAVWLGGYVPAVIVTIFGYLACSYFFIEPRGQIRLADPGILIGVLAYLFTCALIIGFGEAMRHAQMRAGQRREVLRVTLHSIGDAVITTDVDGRITYMNAVAESLTGWTHREAVGQSLDAVFRIVNEDTRQPVPNPATKALRDGVVVGLVNHTILLQKGGGECPIDDSAAPISDEDGNVSGCVLIFRDVSAQRRVQRERASQLLAARLLASIIESSDDAILSKSLDGIIQSWNAGAERLFGYTAAQAVGRHISLIIPPDRIDEEDHIIASLKAGHRIDHFETERVTSDGRRLLVSLTISPIKDDEGRVIGASKIVRDVTVQRQLEQRERMLLVQAAVANAKFQAFFEQGALFAGIMELDGTLLEANRLSWEACGFTKEQAIGKPFWEGPWWSPSAQLSEQIRAASAQAARGETFRAEIPYFVGDGSERIADVTIQPIRDDAGRVLFLAPTGVDITDRRRVEAEREKLEDNLRELAANLSEADRRKNEFLAMLAHELRNPLAPMSNAVRALRLGGHEGESLRSASDMLERQVRQMSRLVDDLLDMSRITRGRIELRKEPLELAPVVSHAVEAARSLYRSMDHELTVTMPDAPMQLSADPARLAQVIGNLLNNASKFTDKGGHVWLMVEKDGHEAVIRVRDNGIGIAQEHIPGLWEMFAQVDTSLERSRGGLGIGLTLVKTLVEMHGGTVEAQSDGLTRGSEFTVRLPILSDAALPASHTSVSEPPLPTMRRRVLIVDDSEDGAESLAMLLQLGGHETHIAHDGVEAIEAAEKLRPDVVLLDIGLPRLNGYEVCHRLRKEPWAKDLVLVALTGWGQEEDRHRSREAGFDAHLVKPVDHDALLRLLASLPGVDRASSLQT
ncbi:MAG TPA: PAS domain S-box protein, partial [Vicinamibacterales bacterium]|nr:PAS domain S-box protein [Vicinamibacterales bacterium]